MLGFKSCDRCRSFDPRTIITNSESLSSSEEGSSSHLEDGESDWVPVVVRSGVVAAERSSD